MGTEYVQTSELISVGEDSHLTGGHRLGLRRLLAASLEHQEHDRPQYNEGHQYADHHPRVLARAQTRVHGVVGVDLGEGWRSDGHSRVMLGVVFQQLSSLVLSSSGVQSCIEGGTRDALSKCSGHKSEQRSGRGEALLREVRVLDQEAKRHCDSGQTSGRVGVHQVLVHDIHSGNLQPKNRGSGGNQSVLGVTVKYICCESTPLCRSSFSDVLDHHWLVHRDAVEAGCWRRGDLWRGLDSES
jgi:hypothetical protein